MNVPVEIYEKAKRAEELREELEKLEKELNSFFRDAMDGCGIVDYGVEDRHFGEDQGDGEWVDQGGNPDTGYSGTVYFQAENGKYVTVGYECW